MPLDDDDSDTDSMPPGTAFCYSSSDDDENTRAAKPIAHKRTPQPQPPAAAPQLPVPPDPPDNSDLDPTAYQPPKLGLMMPNGPALKHPAAKLLLEIAVDGIDTGITQEYPLEVLEAAIHRGAHPSAQELAAATALRLEILEKVQQGFARLIPWKVLKTQLPRLLKLSPIAAIPHKSRAYRMILD